MDTDAEKAAVRQLREIAEKKYPRKLGVLANRLQWSRSKLSKILAGEQPARMSELLLICATVGVPLSQLLHRVGA